MGQGGSEGAGAGSAAESSLDLFRRAREGDTGALSRLVERYLPQLRAWARGRLPRWARDLIDTDDVVQETLIATLRKPQSINLDREAALRAYLREAVLNRIRDEIRRAKRRPEHVEPAGDEVDPAASPLEAAIGRQNLDRYEAALARLREEDREAIVAKIEMGCGYRELAEALGKPSADAARMAVQRALVRLAEEMTKVGR